MHYLDYLFTIYMIKSVQLVFYLNIWTLWYKYTWLCAKYQLTGQDSDLLHILYDIALDKFFKAYNIIIQA